MTTRQFERAIATDVLALAAAGGLVVATLGVGPEWLTGVVAIVVVPVVVIAIVLHAATSHRRDTKPFDQEAVQCPDDSGSRPAPLLRGRPDRADVVTSWVDYAWACHWSALHTYRSTRPGR